MTATIEIRNLEIYARHGCFAEEQVVGNQFIVDADLRVDAARPAESDDIADALNYVGVVEVVREEMAKPSHLLEHVVGRIVARLRAEYGSAGLEGGWVRVRKMAPPVGVRMESVGVKMEI
ncbi:MAG: dihydroneopterin aldolase [Bacteroidales bacterium]|nr:dihydroneopterin aldolase [Bacteroidales bacterium]